MQHSFCTWSTCQQLSSICFQSGLFVVMLNPVLNTQERNATSKSDTKKPPLATSFFIATWLQISKRDVQGSLFKVGCSWYRNNHQMSEAQVPHQSLLFASPKWRSQVAHCKCPNLLEQNLLPFSWRSMSHADFVSFSKRKKRELVVLRKRKNKRLKSGILEYL